MAWSSGILNIAAAPGGIALCGYAWCCGCLASGDTNTEIGGNYWAACCLPMCIPCLGFCIRCTTRRELAKKYGIPAESLPVELITLCCCNGCALRQELNQIAKAKGVEGPALFKPENGVTMRKPPADAVGKALPYAIQVMTGGLSAAQDAAKNGAAK